MVYDKGPCDKCGKEVAPKNNAVYWAIAYHALRRGDDAMHALEDFIENPANRGLYNPRHLIKTESCEGSPSRASMALEGKISYDDGKKLSKSEWKPMKKKKNAEYAKKAYEIIQELVG